MYILRYFIIQAISYLLDLLIFILLYSFLNFKPIFSNLLGKISTGLFSFIYHRKFTFNMKNNYYKQALRYSLSLLLNLPFSSLSIYVALFFVDNVFFAKLISDIFCMFINFLVCKKFIFI